MTRRFRGMPLNALRSFEAAARHLSFAEAGEELGVTAAAVSLQVKRLEDWIGDALFVRGHRSIALTPAGETLAPRLGELLLEMQRLLAAVERPDAGLLRISAMPSFAAKWVAPRLSGFTALHPEVQVQVAGGDPRSDFDRDGVDIGLRYGDGDYEALFCQRIARAIAFPVCSPALAAACGSDPAALDPSLLLQDESSHVAPGLPTWDVWLEAAGVRRKADRRAPRFGNSHMALTAAMAGQGFALGLSPLVDDDLAAGRLVRPFALELESRFGFWFVCRKDRRHERRIAAFHDWIFDQAAAAGLS